MRRFLLSFQTCLAISALLSVLIAPRMLAQTPISSSREADDHKEQLCLVSGRVVTADEGVPLGSARIVLTPEQFKTEFQVYAALSEADGHFVLKDVKAGRYKFLTSRAGFVAEYWQSQGNGDGAVLNLRPGQQISDPLFRMTRAAVITGHISDEKGDVLVGTRVVALRKPTEDEIEEADRFSSQKEKLCPVGVGHTDDRGNIVFLGSSPESIIYSRQTNWIRISSARSPLGDDFFVHERLGSEYAPIYYPGVAQMAQAEVIPLRPGDEVQADVSMRHIKSVEVSGRVLGQNGPAKGAWVALDSANAQGFGSRYQDTTDEKGNFKLRGVPPGSYVLMVYQSANNDHHFDMSARQNVEVGGEDVESLAVSISKGVTLQGRITGLNQAALTMGRIAVSLTSTDQVNIGHSATIKKDNTFEVASLADGSYRLEVWGLENGWYVKSARIGDTDILEEGLHVEKGASEERIEIVVSSECAQLEGTVTDGAQTLAGTRVRMTPDPETPYNRLRSGSAMTDQ